MKLAIYNDDGLIGQIYHGNDEAIAALKAIHSNSLELADDVDVDLSRPAYVKDGKVTQPELSDSEKHAQVMLMVREHCRSVLVSTDKWMLPDSPSYISSKLDDWKTYRQTIRDFPATIASSVTSISSVTFPTPPSST